MVLLWMSPAERKTAAAGFFSVITVFLQCLLSLDWFGSKNPVCPV